jgi:hypothetical protein
MFQPHMKRIFAILSAVICLAAFSALCHADAHLVTMRSWEYGGYQRGDPILMEVWLSPGAECRMAPDKILIHRYDKGLRWIIDTAGGTYREMPVDPVEPEDVSEEILHNEGFEYEPEFDWILEETGEDTVLCGIPCRKYVLDGDADYAETVIEFWAAEDTGIGAGINERSLHYLRGYEMADLIDQFEELTGCLILFEKSTIEGAIAPKKVIEFEVIEFEDAAPPEGIYELPDGLKQID